MQDTSNQFAIFKYEQPDYCCSEACSEKLCYEIAVCLKYPCARIELAKDENGTLGVLNYDFILTPLIEHTDVVAFLNPNQMSRK